MNNRHESFRHPNFCFEVVAIGAENQKIIIVDNFLKNAASLIEYAIENGQVAPAKGLYPGLRSPSPDLYGEVVLSLLGEIICEAFELTSSDIATVASTYSMVATPFEQLQTYQQIPHFDRPKPDEVAMVHYLCGPGHGGTSFYRHRGSGYEFINQDRLGSYFGMLEKELLQVGLPQPQSYINGDTPLFERIRSVDAKFNRCLIYRCSSLHSGDIPLDYSFDMDPRTGRFTMTSFLYKHGVEGEPVN